MVYLSITCSLAYWFDTKGDAHIYSFVESQAILAGGIYSGTVLCL